jgi:hypothetical protein
MLSLNSNVEHVEHVEQVGAGLKNGSLFLILKTVMSTIYSALSYLLSGPESDSVDASFRD